MSAQVTKIDQLILIAETALVSGGFRTLPETLNRICRYVYEIFECVDVQIRTVDEGADVLRVSGYAGTGAIGAKANHEELPIGDETISKLIPGRLSPSVEVYRSASAIHVPTTEYRHGSVADTVLTRGKVGATYYAPIIRESRVVGVLVCYRRQSEAPSEQDRELIAMICRLTAISLSTAKTAEDTRRVMARLETVQDDLQSDNVTLRGALEAQLHLIETLAGGGSATLEQLCRTLAAALDRSVAVIDRDGRALSLVSSDVEADASLRAAVQRQVERLRSHRRKRPSSDDYSAVELANPSGGAALGTLICAPALGAESPFADLIVRHTGLVIAAYLQSKDADAALSRSAKPFALLALAHGLFNVPQVQEAYGLFDLPPFADTSLIVMLTDSEESALTLGRSQAEFPTIGWPILSAVSDSDRVLMLIRGSDVARSELQRLFGSSSQVHAIGVSTALPGLEHLPRGLREASMAARFAKGTRAVSHFADLGVFAALAVDRPIAEVNKFVLQHLGELIRYDAQHGTQLVPTLTAFLQHDRVTAAAAKQLQVHVNTLHQRLHRIEALTKANLKSLNDVLQLRIAIDWLPVVSTSDVGSHGG